MSLLHLLIFDITVTAVAHPQQETTDAGQEKSDWEQAEWATLEEYTQGIQPLKRHFSLSHTSHIKYLQRKIASGADHFEK
jgi:hypothetical protein